MRIGHYSGYVGFLLIRDQVTNPSFFVYIACHFSPGSLKPDARRHGSV
jgi:hypothetical protein